MPFDKKNYESLAAKFKLPSCEELEKELDIKACESDIPVLRQVRQCLHDRMMIWAEMLEDVISPDPTKTFAVFESHFFTESERNDAFALYKRLMALDRGMLEALVLADEKADAEIIRKVWSEWNGLKKDVLQIVRKLKDCWHKDVTREDYLEYLG